jgi:hypothetical protein
MMQLLGGVAVAGVVAAGSTAFTGTGVVLGEATETVIGGTVRQNVEGGLSVTGVTYTFVDTTGTTVTASNHVRSASIVFAVAVPATHKVTVTPGGGGFGGTATQMPCTTGDSGVTWVCTTKDVANATNGWFSGLDTFDISVVTV